MTQKHLAICSLLLIFVLQPYSVQAKNFFLFQFNPQYMYEKDVNDQGEDVTNEYFSLGAALYFEPVYINTVPFDIAPFIQHASGISGYYTKGNALDNLADFKIINGNLDYIFSLIPVHIRITYLNNSMVLKIPGDDVTSDLSVFGGAVGYYVTQTLLLGGSTVASSVEADNPIDGYTLDGSGLSFGGLLIYVQHLTGTMYIKIEGTYTFSSSEQTIKTSTTQLKNETETHDLKAESVFFFNQQFGVNGLIESNIGDNKGDEGVTFAAGVKVYPLPELAFYFQYKQFVPKNDEGDATRQFTYGMSVRI